MSKAGWIIGSVLGGSALAYLLWPKDAEASMEPLQRSQQTMDTTELQPTPVPAPAAPRPAVAKPTPVKKPAPKKSAPKPMSVDEQLAQMRAAVQAFEMERDPAGAAAMRKQIAQVLKAEAERAELARDNTRAMSLREQLAALSETTQVGEERFEFEHSYAQSAADDLLEQAQEAERAGDLNKARKIRAQIDALFPGMFT
jgi:hypothetical protein